MPVREVLRMGHPLLLNVAEEVAEFDTATLHALIRDMEDTMQAMQGAGLAAPQIGVSKRIVIFGSRDEQVANPRYPDAAAVPYTVLINPIIEVVDQAKEDGWEGCLSVPGLRGIVPRYKAIRYTGFDPYGEPIARDADDFHARVVQHECDHLNGVLYPMRVEDFTNFGYVDVLFPQQDIPDR